MYIPKSQRSIIKSTILNGQQNPPPQATEQAKKNEKSRPIVALKAFSSESLSNLQIPARKSETPTIFSSLSKVKPLTPPQIKVSPPPILKPPKPHKISAQKPIEIKSPIASSPPPKSDAKLIGTSKALEKEYLRLTSAPDPESVRSLKYLKKSFEFCMKKFRSSEDYEYISEQLRSIRQDILVQSISNEFTLKVYETHAFLAVEHRDWENFSQIQDQIDQLYEKGFGEAASRAKISACRLLFLVSVGDLTGICTLCSKMSPEIFKSDAVQFAVRIWGEVCSSQWHLYLKETKAAEMLFQRIMERNIDEARNAALRTIVSGFRIISIEGYKDLLCLDSDEEARQILTSANVAIPSK